MTWMRSYTRWTWQKNGKWKECTEFCCSTNNNPDICMLKLSDQTQDHAQHPCTTAIWSHIQYINLGKHFHSGFYGSSFFKCQQKLLFLWIMGNNFSLAGSEIIRTGEQHIQACFGISTKGQWIYAAVCFITRVRLNANKEALWCMSPTLLNQYGQRIDYDVWWLRLLCLCTGTQHRTQHQQVLSHRKKKYY